MSMQLARRILKAAQIRLHRDLLDRAHDRSHHLQTNGLHWPADLHLHGPHAAEAVQYEPTPTRLFARILRGLDLDFSRFAFVDIGSGKGRVLFMAAEHPFLRVEGVELAAELHEVALRNIAGASASVRRLAPIVAMHMDATDYDFPREPLLIYLFNPFSEPVLSLVRDRLKDSLRDTPRDCFIMYLNAKHRRVFDDDETFEETPRAGWRDSLDRILSPWPIAIYRAGTALRRKSAGPALDRNPSAPRGRLLPGEQSP